MFKIEDKDNNKLYSLKSTDEKNVLGGARKVKLKKIFNSENIKEPLLLAYGGPSMLLNRPCGQKVLQERLKVLEKEKASKDKSLNSSILSIKEDGTENEY